MPAVFRTKLKERKSMTTLLFTIAAYLIGSISFAVVVSKLFGLASLATWAIVAYAFRYSSLAALVTSLFAPFFYALMEGPDVILLAIVIMSALLIYRHSKNIGNLLAGKESRIGAKKNSNSA